MLFGMDRNRRGRRIGPGCSAKPRRLYAGRILVCFFAVAAPAAAAQSAQQTTPGMYVRKDITPGLGNQLPDAIEQIQMRQQNAKKQDFRAADAERKKQIADDTAKLLKLAADLKTELDKTGKDTLSLNVIRKADEIERLAHSVKEKMKLTVGGS